MKKKKNIGILVVLMFAALVTMNVNINLKTVDILDVNLQNAEALASSEWSFWDGLGNFLSGQGWTKDEREWIRPCPSEQSSSGSGSVSYGGGTASGSGSSSTTNPSGRNEITCPYGSENCTQIKC